MFWEDMEEVPNPAGAWLWYYRSVRAYFLVKITGMFYKKLLDVGHHK